MSSFHGLGPESFGAVLNCVADGVFTIDREWKITFFNNAAEQITGVPRAIAIGQRCSKIFSSDICDGDCAMQHSIITGSPVIGRLISIARADGSRAPISVSTALLKDEGDRIIGGVETFRDLSHVQELRRKLIRRYRFSNIITQSHRLQEILDMMPQIGSSESTCLIGGESGTGKELLARAIHRASPRARNRFVAVNCGALPDALLESELFGHEVGAFTDAKRARPGRFAAAEGGTLFLDEVGDVSPALQVRLLRVLQEKEYQRLGSNEAVKADVRIIAATNKNLEKMMASGEFRSDLYYRLNVVSLEIPPLRERTEDIPLLCEHFVDRFMSRKGKDISGVAAEVLALFLAYPWPGNVRELENAIEYAFVLCPGGLIQPEHLPNHFRPAEKTVRVAAGGTLAEIEARVILETLERNGGRRSETAKQLGISKATLWRKLRKFGVE